MFENFFLFKKRSEPKRAIPVFKSSLTEIPIFSSLKPDELKLIESKIRHVEFKKGDFVYRNNEPADAFYIVISGRFSIIGARGNVLSVLTYGDYFGESSILLNRTHSAAVQAKNSGTILKIQKDDFLKLLELIPKLSVHLSRVLGHRLTQGLDSSEVKESKIISFVGISAEKEKSLLVWNLASLLAQSKKKRILFIGIENEAGHLYESKKREALFFDDMTDSQQIKTSIQKMPNGIHFLRVAERKGSDSTGNKIALLLSYLVNDYDYLLINLPLHSNEIQNHAVQQSDLIYFCLNDSERGLDSVRKNLDEFFKIGFGHEQIRIVISEDLEKENVRSTISIPVFHFIPRDSKIFDLEDDKAGSYAVSCPDSPFSRAIRYLSRELTGNLIGLALGGGAAYGLAHIGVLKMIEAEKIPVDIIAGASIGALLGSMWASGITSHELENISFGLKGSSSFFKLVGFTDFSAPYLGFFKGAQVSRFLRGYLARKTFRSLNIPVKIIAANLSTGEEVILDDGDLVDAIRASISIPGIVRPAKYDDQFLIDGGVIDPLPVGVLRHYGAKKIIAVNVLAAPDDRKKQKDKNEKRAKALDDINRKRNIFGRTWFKVQSQIKERYRPNIFNVLMNTIQFLEYEIAKISTASADVVLHPVLNDAHWAEFHQAKKFIDCGEATFKAKLAEIKHLVEENI